MMKDLTLADELPKGPDELPRGAQSGDTSALIKGVCILQIVRRLALIPLGWLALALIPSSPVTAQEVTGNRISCSSQLGGGRVNCPADTSAGVVLLQSKGEAACLLGRTWGYEDRNIWVTDGCTAEFLAGQLGTRETSSRPRLRPHRSTCPMPDSCSTRGKTARSTCAS